jgi:anti-anti-sigma factor
MPQQIKSLFGNGCVIYIEKNIGRGKSQGLLPMELDIYKKNGYLVFRLKEDVGLNSDLAGLKAVIEHHLAKGARAIAIAFTQSSYLYTRSIAVLIACSEMIKDVGGHLAIIEANRDILDILSVIDFDKVIKIVAAENDLVPRGVSPSPVS